MTPHKGSAVAIDKSAVSAAQAKLSAERNFPTLQNFPTVAKTQPTPQFKPKPSFQPESRKIADPLRGMIFRDLYRIDMHELPVKLGCPRFFYSNSLVSK